MSPETFPNTFKDRFTRRDVLLGSFLKTPTVHATEIFASLGFDFVIVDQEHAPFSMEALDHIALAARGTGIPALVRTADATPSRLASILDMGFTGVIVPHVSSAEAARAIASACRFAGGERGVSPSGRAGNYGGLGLAEHLQHGDRSTVVIAMIEDPAGVAAIAEIATVPGLDGILIGRADLTVALGESALTAPAVVAAVKHVAAACKAANLPVMLHTANPADIPSFLAEEIATAFIVASDQGLLRSAATTVRANVAR